jgi:ribosome maturation factor RimP
MIERDALRDICSGKLDAAGYTLLDFIYKRNRFGDVIDAVIYKKGGVSHKDCAAATRLIHEGFEDAGGIADDVSVTVSSPGISRKFKREIEYELFLGQPVRVHVYAEAKERYGAGTLIGTNEGLAGGVLTIAQEKGKKTEIAFDDIRYVKLNY